MGSAVDGVGSSSPVSSAATAQGLFSDGACLGEIASSLWNKVLQTSLSFVSVCSGAGVGSVRSYTVVVVACWLS